MSKWKRKLEDAAAQALDDTLDMLAYEPLVVGLGEGAYCQLDYRDGKVHPVKVSKCGEGTRMKLNLALVQLHPESVAKQASFQVSFAMSPEAFALAQSTQREISQSRQFKVIDGTIAG